MISKKTNIEVCYDLMTNQIQVRFIKDE